MKKRIVLFALDCYPNLSPALKITAVRGVFYLLTAIFFAAVTVFPAGPAAGADSGGGTEKNIEKRENKSKKQSKESVKKNNGVKDKKNKAPVEKKVKNKAEKSKESKNKPADKTKKKSADKKNKPADKKNKKPDLKKVLPPKDLNAKVLNIATDEIIINSKKYKVGGISLEKSKTAVKKSKINEIKKLAADVKKDFEEHKKANPRKKNRYSLDLPHSYHDIDMKLASEIMRRVNLSSLSMFKTLYLPHLKKARSVKIKPGLKNQATGDKLDERTKMALFIVGSFINEDIEKYDSGNLSKTHKDFGRWINEGANLLAYGTIFPGHSGVQKSAEKSVGKKGVIRFETAKKLLRALIEVESSAVQMKQGRVNISLSMRTYPRDGSYVIGFMQESVDDFARGVNLFDPETNIKYTSKKLHKYLIKYDGNYDKALRHYNAGQRNMDCAQAHRYSAKVQRFMERY